MEQKESVKIEADSVKCESCGANMVFDPNSQMLMCPHCGAKKSTGKTVSAKELDIFSGFNINRDWNKDETSVFHCQNCGADVVLSKGEATKSCPFCGTFHVKKTEDFLGVRPNGVVPFKFDKEKAVGFACNWVKKKLFAPTKFKKNIKTENLNGIYIPCFTFDSSTVSTYMGRIGTTHTRTVGSGKNKRTETYTVWRNISGTFYMNFDDVLVTAGNKFEQNKLNKISPFYTNESREYQGEFLLGFMAYHYDKDITLCWEDAKKIMEKDIKKGILQQYNYDKVDYLNCSVSHNNMTYKYVMLPTYVGNFTYNKKLYNFYVNGSTGKTCGKTPISFFRVLFAVLLVVLIIGLIVGLVLLLQ